jgi:hypothetical protein
MSDKPTTSVNFHNFTDTNGEVLMVKRIPQSRKTHGDFLWPSGIGTVVVCPDWRADATCGGGLHAWPWGFGIGDGCDIDIIGDIWLVLGAKPEDIIGEIDRGAKCKARRVTIRLEGTFGAAMNFVRSGFDGCVAAMAKKNPSGDSSKAASSGNYSTAASSGNYSKAASSGNFSKAASSGNSSTAEAVGGNNLAAVCGANGKVRVGSRGAFALAFYTDADGWRFLTGKVGEDGIKADTWYEIVNGKIEEVK